MKNPPIFFIVFTLFSGVFLLIRNFYFYRVWLLKNNIDDSGLYKRIFREGLDRFMLPMLRVEEINNIKKVHLKNTINKLNTFNYLSILSFVLAIVMFCFS